MKMLLFLSLLFAGLNSYACKTPDQFDVTSINEEVESCFQLDQDLSAERSELIRTAFVERRELSSNEVLRRKEIVMERLQMGETLLELARYLRQ